MPGLPDTMYCSQQIHIPPMYPYVLKQYAKAAIKTQPTDLLSWTCAYFRALSLNLEAPVKDRLEYPDPRCVKGLTPGFLRILIKQIGKDSKYDIKYSELLKKWEAICLNEKDLICILLTCRFEDPKAIKWLNFIAVCAGLLSENLTNTMILLCNILTEEPEGGNAMLPLEMFLQLYQFLANLDCFGKRYVCNNFFFRTVPVPKPEPFMRLDTSIGGSISLGATGIAGKASELSAVPAEFEHLVGQIELDNVLHKDAQFKRSLPEGESGRFDVSSEKPPGKKSTRRSSARSTVSTDGDEEQWDEDELEQSIDESFGDEEEESLHEHIDKNLIEHTGVEFIEQTDQKFIEQTVGPLIDRTGSDFFAHKDQNDFVEKVIEDTVEKVIEHQDKKHIVEDTVAKAIEHVDKKVIEHKIKKVIERTGKKVVEHTGEKVIEHTGEKVIKPTVEKDIEHTGKKVIEHTDGKVIEHTDKDIGDHIERIDQEHIDDEFMEDTEEDYIDHPEEEDVEHTDEKVIEHTGEKYVEHTDENVIEQTGEKVIRRTDKKDTDKSVQYSISHTASDKSDTVLSDTKEGDKGVQYSDPTEGSDKDVLEDTDKKFIEQTVQGLIDRADFFHPAEELSEEPISEGRSEDHEEENVDDSTASSSTDHAADDLFASDLQPDVVDSEQVTLMDSPGQNSDYHGGKSVDYAPSGYSKIGKISAHIHLNKYLRDEGPTSSVMTGIASRFTATGLPSDTKTIYRHDGAIGAGMPEEAEQEIVRYEIPDVPGIGPVVDKKTLNYFVDFIRGRAELQHGMVFARNLTDILCPPLENFSNPLPEFKNFPGFRGCDNIF